MESISELAHVASFANRAWRQWKLFLSLHHHQRPDLIRRRLEACAFREDRNAAGVECVNSTGRGSARGNRQILPGGQLSKPAMSAKCAKDYCCECTKVSCTCECHQPIKKSPQSTFSLDAPSRATAFSHS